MLVVGRLHPWGFEVWVVKLIIGRTVLFFNDRMVLIILEVPDVAEERLTFGFSEPM